VASYETRPTQDLVAGRAVLEADLPLVLDVYGAARLEDLGWRREGLRKLIIPFSGGQGKETDTYLLRLDFRAGRDWPPSAQFVNPQTLTYNGLADQHHLPQLRSPEVHVHPQYQAPVLLQPIQLICCSATYEYYDVLHAGDAALLWQNTDNFLITLSAIGRAMAQHYHGRFAAHVG
jgi:hypothetical protein